MSLTMVRLAERAAFALILACWAVTGLWVDPRTMTPFSDEKGALFLILSGLTGLPAAFLCLVRGTTRAIRVGLVCLSPLAVLAVWRTWESVSAAPRLEGTTAGLLPIKTHFILQVLSPLAAAGVLWLAAALITCSSARLKWLLRSLFILLFLESAGLGAEWLGTFFGKEWRPFLGSAAVAPGQVGLKTQYFGSLGNANFLASYLALLFFPALSFCLGIQRWVPRFLSLIVCGCCLMEILMCRSKGALAALLIAGATLLVLRGIHGKTICRKFTLRRVLLTGALLVPTLTGLVVLWEGLDASSGSSLSDTLRLRGESSSQRLLLAWTAVHMWEDTKLAGIGPGEFRLRFLPEINRMLAQPGSGSFRGRIEKMKSFKPVHVHNDYLETWTEWGCLGYASAAAFLIGLIVQALRRSRGELELGESASPAPSRFVWRGLLGGVFVCLAYAALEFPFHLPAHLSLFAAFLGFACSPVASGSSPDQNDASRRRLAILDRVPLAAALAILSAVLIWNGLSLYRASRMIKTATDLVVTQPALQVRASTLARRASLLDPSNVKMRLALAQIQWRIEDLPSVARSTLRQAIPVSDEPNLRLVEVEILLGEGKFDEAARTLQAFDEVGRFLPGVGYLEGRIVEWRKKDELAAQAYQKDLTALGNHPGIPHQHLPDLYLRYGGVLERLGRYSQAIAMYKKHQDILQGRQTNIPLGLLKMGVLYRDRLEDYTSARRCFEQALEAARKSGGPGEIDNARNELQLLHSRVETLKASTPVILDVTGEDP